MNRLFACTMAAVLSAGVAIAQESTPQPNRVAAGVVIPAELTKSLDAKKNKPGDPVEAKTTQDLLSNGQVVIPRGSKITGHVTAAKPHDKSDPASTLGMAFDQLAIKSGQQVAFQADIQAIGKSPDSMGGTPMAGDPMADTSGMPSQSGANQPMGGTGRAGAPAGAPPSPTGATESAPHQATGTPLSASSQGVVGMEDLSLGAGSGDAAQGSVINSSRKNVHLDSGTQLILRVKQAR